MITIELLSAIEERASRIVRPSLLCRQGQSRRLQSKPNGWSTGRILLGPGNGTSPHAGPPSSYFGSAV
jgi:hypothetical protein